MKMSCIGHSVRHTASISPIAISQTSTKFFTTVSQDSCLKLWELLNNLKTKLEVVCVDYNIIIHSLELFECKKQKTVTVRQSDNEPIKIIIYLVGDISPSDSHYIHIFNIIMRKCLEHLKLQLVSRKYFDAHNRVAVQQFKLELWPSYITSIRRHEHDVLMYTEIAHKVMRQETLFYILKDCYRRSDDYKTEFCNWSIIGVLVLMN